MMINPTATLRFANEKDAPLLATLGARTFIETYGEFHSENDMASYLQSEFYTEKILKDIRDKNTLFLIASIHNKVSGYAKLTSKHTPNELRGLKAIALERIYVLKEMTGKQIGGALLGKCLEASKNKGFRIIWLSVWKNNSRAISFYEKFGFKIFGKTTFQLDKTTRNNLLMKKELKQNST